MVGRLTTLKLSMLAQSSGEYSSKAGKSVLKKSGLLGSDPSEVVLGNSAKMFCTVVVLIFVNFDVEAELDKVPTMVLCPTLFFFCDR